MIRARLLAATPISALLAVLLWRTGAFVHRGFWAIAYPFQLDYGEGIVWEQVHRIVTGTAYGAIQGFPAIVFHYPPVFHLLTRGVAALTNSDELSAGRLLSLGSALVAAACAGLITMRLLSAEDRLVRWTCGLIAALLVPACGPVAAWAPFMRVDMLALALALLGYLAGLSAIRRPWLIHVAAALFVAAIYTKQTMIAAPAAVFLPLLFQRPRTAIAGIATGMALASAVLVTMQVITEGGFLRHILFYNVNRYEPARLMMAVTAAASHAVFLVAALLGLASSWRGLMSQPGPSGPDRGFGVLRAPDAMPVVAASTYLAITTLMLALIGKVGSNINYTIEWFVALCVFAGVGARPAAIMAFRSGKERLPSGKMATAATLVLVLAFQVVRRDFSYTPMGPEQQAQMTELQARIRAASKPVISDDMVVVKRASKSVVWEPAIFAELGATGVYDERPFISLVRQRAFAFFVTEGVRGDRSFDSRYNPPVADAIVQNYPREERLAGLTIHMPAD